MAATNDPDLKVGLAIQTLGKTPINGLRHLPVGDTSGWYIWAGESLEDTDDFFQPVHTHHLLELVPDVVDLLNLEPGWRFLVADGMVDTWFDPTLLGVAHMRYRDGTDFSKSLDELQGSNPSDPSDAPTPMVADIIRSRRKPLGELTLDEIGRFVVQRDGFPFILDLVWPLLEGDPLIDGGYYPGDILSNLIRADEGIWRDRPAYREGLKLLYRRAVAMPDEDKHAFLESLGLENDCTPN